MKDITETGPVGLKGLSGLNRRERYGDFAKLSSIKKDPNATGNAFTGAPVREVGEELGRLGYGESQYDEDILSVSQAQDIDEYRAAAQPWYDQLANGTLKMVTTAATTFIDSTVGFLYGIGQGIYNKFDGDPKTGFWRGMWDNTVSNAMAAANEGMEELFKNYRSEWEQNASVFERMFSSAGAANFWGDDILKNAGFTLGAAGAIALTGGLGDILAASNGFGKAAQFLKLGKLGKEGLELNNAGKFVSWLTKTYISTQGEAAIESVNAINQNRKSVEANVEARKRERTEDAEIERQLNMAKGMSQYEADALYRQRVQTINEDAVRTLQQAEAEFQDAGNMIYAANVLALSLSNNLTLGSMLRGGYDSSKSLLKQALKTSAGKPINNAKEAGKALLDGTLGLEAPKVEGLPAKIGARWLLSSTQEGLEEGVQNLASNAGQIASQARLNTWVKDNTMLGSMINPDASEDLVSYTKAVSKAWEEQFGKLNSPGWTEVMAGFLTGLLGFPSAHMNQNGKIRPTWQGGIREQLEYFNGPTKAIQRQADLLNKALTDEKFGNRVKHAVQQIAIKRGQDNALENGNILAFKNLEIQQLLSDAVFFRDMGMLDDYLAIYDALAGGLDAQDVAELKAAAKDEKTGKSALDEKTDDEIKDLYKTKAESTLAKVKEALDNYEDVEKRYGERFSRETRDAAVMEMSFLNLLQWDTYRRLDEVNKEIEELDSKEKTTALEDARYRDLTKAAAELEKQGTELRDLLNEYKLNPKKLQAKVEAKQLAAQKQALYKKAEEAIKKYKEANTLKDVIDVYLHSPENDREAVLNQVIDQAEGDNKALLQNLRDFLNDTTALGHLIDDKFKPDSLDGVMLNKLFRDAANEVLKEMLEEESPTLSRKTLKDKFTEKLQDWQWNADWYEREAYGTVINDDGSADFQKPQDDGILYGDNFEEVLDNPDTGESHLEIIKGSHAERLLENATKAKQWKELVSHLQDIIDSLDKLDELRKAAPKKSKTEKKEAGKKETKEGKKTTFTEEPVKVEKEEDNEEPPVEEEEKEETPDLLSKEEKKFYDIADRKESSGVTYHTIKKKGKKATDGVKKSLGKKLGKTATSLEMQQERFSRSKTDKTKREAIKKMLDIISKNITGSETIEEMEKFFKKNKKYMSPDSGEEPSKPPHNNKDGQDLDDGASLKGNQHPAYVGSELDSKKKVVKVTYQKTGTPVQVTLDSEGFSIQEVIDNYLYKVIERDAQEDNVDDRTPVHYLHNNKLGIDAVVVLAFKASDVDDVIPTSNIKTITIDGEVYIPIGTLGYRAQDKGTDAMYSSILDETSEEEHNSEGWAVNSKHTNRIKSITAGATVKQTLEDNESKIRDLRELLGLGRNPRNPNGLDIDDIGWTVVEGKEDSIKYKHIKVKEGKAYPLAGGRPGQVYMHIPASNGMTIPVYIEATFLNEIEEDTPLYEEVKRQIDIISSRESTMADRKAAVGRLNDLLVFSKPNQIHINDEANKYDPNTVYITRNGQPIKVLDFNTNGEEDLDLLEAIQSINPRINLSTTELDRNPEIYLNSGALRTDIAYLGTVNAKFYIFPVDKDNNLLENKVPETKTPKYDGSVRQREYLNGQYIYYDGKKFTDSNGNVLEDEDGTLQIAYDIKQGKLKGIKYNGFVYYDVDGTMYTDNGHGGIVSVDDEYREKVLEKGKKESKAKKAKKDIEKEVKKAEKKEGEFPEKQTTLLPVPSYASENPWSVGKENANKRKRTDGITILTGESLQPYVSVIEYAIKAGIVRGIELIDGPANSGAKFITEDDWDDAVEQLEELGFKTPRELAMVNPHTYDVRAARKAARQAAKQGQNKEKKNFGNGRSLDDVKTKEELESDNAQTLFTSLSKRGNEEKVDKLYDLVKEKFKVEADNDEELVTTLIEKNIDITSGDLDTVIDIVENCR